MKLGITAWFILTSALLTIISLMGDQAFAQNSTDFLTYTNPVHGLKIQYPSDWQMIPDLGNGSGFNILVRFLPSFVNGSGTFLNFDILEVQNKSGKLNDYMKSSFDRIFSFPRDYNFNLIYSAIDNVSLTGSPAYQFEYFNTAPYDPSKLIKVNVIGTIIGNTNYEVLYAADLYSYSRYLETATKMIYSLQINSTTSFTA